MKKQIITVSLVVAMATVLVAKPNIDNSAMKENMKKIAGERGVFVRHEMFPKDYFLISKSLPYMVGLALFHPRSSELGLSKNQLEQIKKIKSKTMPMVIKSAKEIKELELALSKRMVNGAKAKDEFKAVDEIAAKKVALTKKHLICIESARNILTPKQREILLSYVGTKGHKKYKDRKKHKVRELVKLPHPLKLIMKNKKLLNISPEQMEKIESQIMAVFPEKIHGNMDKAAEIEKKIKKSVMLDKATKETLQKEIESLIAIKVQITKDHIDALNKLQSILTKEQYSQVLSILKKGSHKH